MKLPQGRLVRKRVVSDLGTVLSHALDAGLTGYARLESQDALLLDADGVGVLTFEDGVPVVAYHTGSDASGRATLADIAVAGPFLLELYRLDADVLAEVHATEEFRIPPDTPAERLAGDPHLAERTRERAPAERLADGEDRETAEVSAVEAFLDDEEKVAAIRERAREEAKARAAEWGFDE
jgi:hypothetical protein